MGLLKYFKQDKEEINGGGIFITDNMPPPYVTIQTNAIGNSVERKRRKYTVTLRGLGEEKDKIEGDDIVFTQDVLIIKDKSEIVAVYPITVIQKVTSELIPSRRSMCQKCSFINCKRRK